MKKGYHDYTPLLKTEKVVAKKQVVKNPKQIKYIKNGSGHSFPITNEKGHVTASTDILMFGNKINAWSHTRTLNINVNMDTKSYIKFSGHLS
tara:strand:- start:201 stop:476 length:276 start_codon:yes stop_codon:yes gene_type:complete